MLDIKRTYEVVCNTDGTNKAPAISLYNTDDKIFNIKVFIESGKGAELTRHTKEDLQAYKLKMEIVKPSKNYKKIYGVLQDDGSFLFDMPKDTYDAVGSYKVQTFLINDNSTVDDTTDDIAVTFKEFGYTIVGSIATGLNGEITSNPDLPIVEKMLEEIRVAAGLTIDEPNEVIANLEISDITTDEKVLKNAINELDEKIRLADAKEIVLTGNKGTLNESNLQYKNITADTELTLPTTLNKRLLVYIKCTGADRVLTFKYVDGGTPYVIKFKLKNGSLNVFTLDCKGIDVMVQKHSSEDAALTEDEVTAGILI